MKIDERLQRGHSFGGMYRIASGNVREAVARNPLAAAFLISLLIHALLFGGWRMGKSLGWWDHQATWLLNITKKLQSARMMARFTPPPAQRQMREIPLMFMEGDPTLAVVEPPKDAKFYGAQNSQVRNPDERDKLDPKVDGKQTKVVRAEDVPKPKPFPLQPAIDTPQPRPEEGSKKSEPAGDLARIEKGEEQPHEKPRTLAQARAQKNMLA